MSIRHAALSRLQLSDALSRFPAPEAGAAPRGGWVSAVRRALGMTGAQLAARMGVSRSTVQAMEAAEARRRITLDSLDRLARAMDCTVVYALVPRGGSLDAVRQARAHVLAGEMLAPTGRSMALEAQDVAAEGMDRQRKLLAESLLQGSPRKLWE